MPNTRSARKRLRQIVKRTLLNKMYRSRMKTAIRRFEEALAAGDRQRIEEALRRAFKFIDKAAKRGVIHANAAARRKSRLTRLLNRQLATAS